MRKSLIATAVGLSLVLSACSEEKTMISETSKTVELSNTATIEENNVLLQRSSLQDQAPQFDKIKTADFKPAFSIGISAEKAEFAQIANNPEAASFANTIVAMEKTGEILDRVSRAFFNLSGLISDENMQQIETEMAPILSAHQDSIFLDAALFGRVEQVYLTKESLNKEDQRLVDYYYTQFLRAGAKLSESEKDKMRALNTELAELSTKYSQNVLKSFSDDVILVEDKELLQGLSDDTIAALAEAAKSAGKTGYMISLTNTTNQPLLASIKNRGLRQKIWQTSSTRAAESNGPVLMRMANLRADKAQLLKYPNWASYVTADQMAQTPQAVFDILDGLAPKALAKAKTEAADIQAMMLADGEVAELEAWDWPYYADKVRSEKFDLDENLVKPYFELSRVLNDGLFFAMNKLYGIKVKERNDLPVWHTDVTAYEIFNEDGSSIGLFYLDPYAREGKSGGAWMDEFVTQSHLLNDKPVVYNAQNLVKPAQGQPTLMSFDEVNTLFHEFGHAVHGLFSEVKYPSLAGTNTARDFVEFPSQFNEDWDIDPLVLANYAKHYQTGEPIPQDLLAKILKARTFNQGFDTTEYIKAALLDMEWHTIPAGTEIKDFNQFESAALAKHGLSYQAVPPRYKSAYFSHIFGGGYSSGYYAYLWTEVFAADAFAYMEQNKGLNRENGENYRKNILSMGNSQELMQDYINFRGQKPSIDALLIRRGLVSK